MHNETLVHFLAVEGFCEALASLAEHGADMNAVNEFGDAPLIDVAVLGFNHIAQVLLHHGADPNADAGSAGRFNARLRCAGREQWSCRNVARGGGKRPLFDGPG